MAYGALVSGLIGAGMAAGDQAGKNMDEARKVAEEQRHKAGALDLYRAEQEMQIEFDKRKAENKQAELRQQGGAISAGQAEILKPRTDAINANLQSAAASGVGGATDFVNNESGISEREKAQAGSTAAGGLGLISQQKEYNDQVKDIDTKDTQDKRNSILDKRDEQRHTEAMAKADAAVKSAEKSAGKVVESQERLAISAGLTSASQMIRDTEGKIANYMGDPSGLKVLQDDLTEYKRRANNYNALLESKAGVAEKAAPTLDSLFPEKKPGATAAKSGTPTPAVKPNAPVKANATPQAAKSKEQIAAENKLMSNELDRKAFEAGKLVWNNFTKLFEYR